MSAICRIKKQMVNMLTEMQCIASLLLLAMQVSVYCEKTSAQHKNGGSNHPVINNKTNTARFGSTLGESSGMGISFGNASDPGSGDDGKTSTAKKQYLYQNQENNQNQETQYQTNHGGYGQQNNNGQQNNYGRQNNYGTQTTGSVQATTTEPFDEVATETELAPPPPEDFTPLPADSSLSVMDRIFKENSLLGSKAAGDVPHQYVGNKEMEVFEGDIIKTPNVDAIVSDMKKVVKDDNILNDAINNGKWPNAIIPYVFATSFSRSGQQVVRNAIAQFSKHTCVKFVPRKRNQRNYVMFYHGGGCSSMIGLQNQGRQLISLAHGCLVTGIAVHEMMHAAGFFHEQSRQDRDNHIQIYWNNINRAMQYNFQKYRAGEASTLHQPYDLNSVMHYGNYAFSTNGRQTIKARNNQRLGQRNGMSKIDIKQLNIYYNCKGASTTDAYPFCPSLKKWCKNDWVKPNCKKTCVTDLLKECVGWKQYCTNPRYTNYMMKNCAKTCAK